MTDPLEQAFLRLRDAADADEYVPTERVIDTVLMRLAVARAENKRLRRALTHIADTCVQDPDTAQFAARVLDGSADAGADVGAP